MQCNARQWGMRLESCADPPHRWQSATTIFSQELKGELRLATDNAEKSHKYYLFSTTDCHEWRLFLCFFCLGFVILL